MSLALRPPVRAMTVADYLALGEDPEGVHTELSEGHLVMSPSPLVRHNVAIGRLYGQLSPQLATDLEAISDTDTDLQLAPSDQPGTVRRPDLAVIRRAAIDRTGREGGILRADDVVLAIEIVSPGSRRLDHLVKRAEYADAGIEHYWVIDLDDVPTMTVCELAEGVYRDGGPRSGAVSLDLPFAVTVDLDALR